MKRIIFTLLIVILLVGCKEPEISTAQKMLIDDLNQLVDIIMTEELLLSDRDTLESLRKEALLKIEENMSERDFYLTLLPIVNCGRVYLLYPRETRERLINKKIYIPIKIKTLDNKTYLIDDKTGTLPSGLEITSINNYPIEKIMETLNMNNPFKEEEYNRDLIDIDFNLKLIDILDSNEYEIILNDNGQLRKYTVPAIDPSELQSWLFPTTHRVSEEEEEALRNATYIGTFKEKSIKKILKNTGFEVKCYPK